MPTKCQQEKKFAAMTICHELLQYTTYMLSYQIKSNEVAGSQGSFLSVVIRA